MPRTAITVTTSDHDGVVYPTAQPNDKVDGMEIVDNDGQVVLIITNPSTTNVVVTVQAAATYGNPPIPLVDRVYAVDAGDAVVAGGFATRLFNQEGDLSTRSVLVDFTGSDGDLDIVAIKVPISGT